MGTSEETIPKCYSLSVTWYPEHDEFTVTGLQVPPWIALGLLKYVEILVRRRDAEMAMRAAMAARPLIAVPGREV